MVHGILPIPHFKVVAHAHVLSSHCNDKDDFTTLLSDIWATINCPHYRSTLLRVMVKCYNVCTSFTHCMITDVFLSYIMLTLRSHYLFLLH